MIPLQENFIRPSDDHWSLRESLTGRSFIPFGCNYYDADTGWPPSLWKKFNPKRIKEQFQMMEDLGVNAIRVWVQWASFMPTKNKLSAEALDKCSELLTMAKRSDIRVNLTGPDFWEGYPAWLPLDEFGGYEKLIHPKYLDAHSTFWGLFADYFAEEETIYGFDLVNEPFMPWSGRQMEKLWNQWIEERFDSTESLKKQWRTFTPKSLKFRRVPIPLNVKLTGSRFLLDYQTFREEMALRWVKNTVQAIRRVDKNHLITVGFHQSSFPLEEIIPSRYTAFNPHVLAPELDYIALHWYPFGNPFTAAMTPYDLPGNVEKSLAALLACLRYSYAGKPMIMEEFSYYGGGSPTFWGGVLPYRTEEQQEDLSKRFIETTIGSCAGWLNWPLVDTPSSTDTSSYGGLYSANGKLKAWGRAFRKLSTRLHSSPLQRRPATAVIPFSRMTALTDGVRCDELFQRCQRIYKNGGVMDFNLDV